MKRQILIYGLVGGLLITLLKWSEYHFLVIEHSFEIYGGLIAAIFAGLGIWLGIRLTARPTSEPSVAPSATAPIPASEPGANPAATPAFSPTQALDPARRADLGITPREFEVLELIAQGMSNREIAEKLFVSENTVKTHSSRVFDKLGAKRRTQAVQLGKELGLLP
jgi:DNA-binding CsgD family transcriptional regulator